MNKFLKFIINYLICSIIGAIVLMIYAFPIWPKTLLGCASLLILGLPIILIAESMGGFLTSERISRKVDSKGENKRFSFKRIAYLLISLGIIFIITFLVSNKLNNGPIGAFIINNFKV